MTDAVLTSPPVDAVKNPAPGSAVPPAPPVQDLPPVDLGGGRCEIMPGTRLPDFDTLNATAFAAGHARDRRKDRFALLISDKMPARMEALSGFRGLEHANVLGVLDWGTVAWGPGATNRFVIIMERPGGRRYMDNLTDPREPVAEDQLVRGLLPVMVSILRDLSMRGLTCGAIRPTNFFQKDANGGFVLGDCVSSPIGFAQPVIVETIERGMCDPAGRGPGTMADDLYALGVTLLILAVGRNPLAALDDEAVLKLKVERGTYGALTSTGVKVPTLINEAIRGLIADEPKLRWTLQDLDIWVQGRRTAPKAGNTPKRAGRPLEFDGQEYWTCRAIARAMARRPAQAYPFITQGELDKWLRRSLGDETRAQLVQTAVDTAAGGGRSASLEDRTVARVVIALDPSGPIRYRDTAVFPEGIGMALAQAAGGSGGDLQQLADIIQGQLPMFWANCQVEFKPELVPLIQKFDLMRVLLEHTGVGFGIERVTYELNPGLSCLSPVVRHRVAMSLPDLMAALDHGGGQSPKPGREPIDRHIAAFIGTHHKRLNEKMLGPLSPGQAPGRKMIAVMTLLADVQNRFGPPKLPDLCAWLVGLAEPAYGRFHHLPTRDRMKEEAEALTREGVVDKLLRLLDNADILRKDERDFLRATQEYEGLTRQIERLEKAIERRGEKDGANGREAAAIVSAVLAMVGLVFSIFLMASP